MEMPNVTSGPVSIGSVLGRSLKELLKRPILYLGLNLLAVIPYGLLLGLGMANMSLALMSLAQIVMMILVLVIQGVIAYMVFHDMAQRQASLPNAIASAMKHIVPMVLAAILTGLAVGIGTLLLIIPGIILMCVLAVTIPACMVEKLGAVDSLKRSAELTKGYRLQIFLMVLIVGIINAVLSGVIQRIAPAFGSIAVMVIVLIAVSIIPQAFNSVMMSVIYHDLRNVKEGVSAEALASVFD